MSLNELGDKDMIYKTASSFSFFPLNISKPDIYLKKSIWEMGTNKTQNEVDKITKGIKDILRLTNLCCR